MESMKRNYELALEVLEELREELGTSKKDQDRSDRPQPQLAPAPLTETLDRFGSLPPAALFLGAAYDGLPILLNLNDPTPGPILITGDQGSGKTAFLQTIAQATTIIHPKSDVQFGIVTDYPNEWKSFEDNDLCMGVFPTYKSETDDFIISLADWAHHNHQESRFALLLVDNLDSMLEMNEEVQQHLRWLLLRGPNRRVWSFVTLNAQRSRKVHPWLDAFRTRLLGSVKNIRDAEAVSHTRDANLHLLEPGLEFLLNEHSQWVKFWIPLVKSI